MTTWQCEFENHCQRRLWFDAFCKHNLHYSNITAFHFKNTPHPKHAFWKSSPAVLKALLNTNGQCVQFALLLDSRDGEKKLILRQFISDLLILCMRYYFDNNASISAVFSYLERNWHIKLAKVFLLKKRTNTELLDRFWMFFKLKLSQNENKDLFSGMHLLISSSC